MRIEIHVLQNFAPSNLNRDDTGSPKDAEFGGYRRARISSQCQKRAVRNYFKDNDLIPAKAAGLRAAHLRRGPWGYLWADDPVVRKLADWRITSLAQLPGLLAGSNGEIRFALAPRPVSIAEPCFARGAADMPMTFAVNDMTIHRIVEQEHGFTPLREFLPTLTDEQ